MFHKISNSPLSPEIQYRTQGLVKSQKQPQDQFPALISDSQCFHCFLPLLRVSFHTTPAIGSTFYKKQK